MRLSSLLLPAAALSLLASCGDATSASDASGVTTTVAGGPTTSAVGALPKPQVKIPAATPTELVVTDLTEGTGAAAVEGDTVVVHYVGVRAADGTEFDNNYDSGTSISVTLGAGEVIKGWDQGLVGVKPGGRRQLDIPAALAYGDSPQGDIIQKGDALTFVIDVVTVIPKPDPTKAPVVSIPPTPNQTAQTSKDLIIGDGASIQPGQTVAVQLLAFSAADGAQIDSSWESGTPLTFVPGAGQLPPGLEKAVEGMKVGGRRQV
ncbi:MAG TPA: FKBP-type peptidyl-prolyl cis-trans isomerase, partial [Ilumatobacteraceae bacterium]|nr:FKBP-type peptidyl-prolyl cis-trans isomerase [Ilumatobacteraceae bacterium]